MSYDEPEPPLWWRVVAIATFSLILGTVTFCSVALLCLVGELVRRLG